MFILRFVSKNLRQKRSHGLAFSPLPETRRGKFLPLAFSLLFFIFCLLYADAVLAATVTLTWDTPTTNSNNTALTDLSGYRVYMSTASGQYNSGNIVKNNIPASSPNGGVTETTTVDNLPNGTYRFVVTAYDIYGNESGYSNEIQKTTTSSGGSNTSTNSSDGGASISAGGCGFVKNIPNNKLNFPAGQFILNFLLIFFPLIFIKIWRLATIKKEAVAARDSFLY